ncbi:MAG: radical SAM protein [Solirubrobacteraceae bacterium]|nr:hypothetical protein [Patulibacter sp.]
MIPAVASTPSLVELEAVKIRALATGLRIEPDLLERLGGQEGLTVHEYATTGGITLELPHGMLVNAPFDAPYCATSDLLLRPDGDALVLEAESPAVRIPVRRVLPLPGYLGVLDAADRPVADTTMSHADRIRVSPIDGCAYDCDFCNVARLRYRERPLDQVLAGIEVAIADRALPPTHLLISGGSPSLGNARGQAYFRDLCVGVLRHLRGRTNPDGSPFEVDIMMSARPDGPAFVREMVAEGAAGFSLNVEVHSDEGAARHLRLKHRKSREHLGPMLEEAAALLGADTGRVRSLIIPGLETVEQTLAGVEWLAARGCSPVLSPFRPAPDTALETADPVSEADLRAVLDGTRAIVARTGVLLGPRCVACGHNTLGFPWDLPGWEAA